MVEIKKRKAKRRKRRKTKKKTILFPFTIDYIFSSIY